MPGTKRLSLFFILILPLEVWAGDWPQFLGPTRNGVYDGSDVMQDWPAKGPTVLWQKAVGHGFSGPAVASGKLILCQRTGEQEIVDCLDARTGAALWHFAYPTSYQDEFGFDDGPRATPNIVGDRVYTFGAQGMLNCLELATGKKVWSVDVQKDFSAPNGFFGLACSPLVEGDAVLLNVGGAQGAGIVAFDKSTGKLLWKSSKDEASYSSPIAATMDGRRYVLFFTRNGLVGTDPVGGQIQFEYEWHSRNRMSVNAATPLLVGDTVFLSACYGRGAVLLRCRDNRLEKVWSGDDLLSNHYATSVELNGFLYGIHGRADPGYSPRPKLRCVNLSTRKVSWETDSIGAATIIRAGNQLWILTEKGELALVTATSDSFQLKGRTPVLSSTARAFPALANGLLYARSQDQLVCVDLRKK